MSSSNSIESLLKEVYDKLSPLSEGNVADYIPELAKANASDFGIVVAMANGNIYQVGDTNKEFTIQSISKPFAYGLALQDLGEDHMHCKVGVEPSGEAFNAISLDPDTGRPRNPMINAGAIATTAQIQHLQPSNAEQVLMSYFSRLAGRKLKIDSSVYMSERDSGHRNRAISHLLKNFNVIDGEPDAGLDLYFRQCSIKVTCKDLAVMASTLCCQGTNPVTHDDILNPDITVQMLSLMGTCGMYDFAGQWLHDVGMPAKSGVGGGILAVIPGRLGLAVYSPPLDKCGNSVRGVAACTELSKSLGLHLYNRNSSAKKVIRRISDGTHCNSRYLYDSRNLHLLREYGHLLKIVHLQGRIAFAEVEEIASFLSGAARISEIIVLDFNHIEAISKEAQVLLCSELTRWDSSELTFILSSINHLTDSMRWIENQSIHCDTNFDSALEIAESLLIQKYTSNIGSFDQSEPTDAFLKFVEIHFESVLQPLQVTKGNNVIQFGDVDNSMYFVKSGRYSTFINVNLGDEKKHRSRLATFTEGMFFGEIGFLSGSRRTADVVVDKSGTLLKLSRSHFDIIAESKPSIALELLSHLSSELGLRLGRTSYQLTTMEHI